MLLENKGERRTKMLLGFYMKVLMAAWKRVYVYAASLVGKKEGRKEIVMELRRNFSSYLPE